MQSGLSFAELSKFQAQNGDFILPATLLSNDRVRSGSWYKVTDQISDESTIILKYPYNHEWQTFHGMAMEILKLSEDVLGATETLKIRRNGGGEGVFSRLAVAISENLSSHGYDSVIFYEKEDSRIVLKEVFVFDKSLKRVGQLSDYHLERSAKASKEVEEMLKHPYTFEEAMEQKKRLNRP